MPAGLGHVPAEMAREPGLSYAATAGHHPPSEWPTRLAGQKGLKLAQRVAAPEERDPRIVVGKAQQAFGR